ncbi:MAG: hypothetical protein ABIN89_21650, partial [Chitinophagaceae bacterium]
MKKTCLLFLLLVFISMSSFSQDKVNNKDSSSKKVNAPKDRNMFGHGIPRGLTITSDDLAEGYVMFSIPNSALVYLINRKGEVVHQWKGNYGGPNASVYLNDDGS